MKEPPKHDELHDGNGKHRDCPPTPLEGPALAAWQRRRRVHLESHGTQDYIAGLLAEVSALPEPDPIEYVVSIRDPRIIPSRNWYPPIKSWRR